MLTAKLTAQRNAIRPPRAVHYAPPRATTEQILIPIGCHPQKRLRHPKVEGYPLRQNQILPRFRGWDMKQILNFTLPPTGGRAPRSTRPSLAADDVAAV
jgi:hypothetical protein